MKGNDSEIVSFCSWLSKSPGVAWGPQEMFSVTVPSVTACPRGLFYPMSFPMHFPMSGPVRPVRGEGRAHRGRVGESQTLALGM